MCSSTGIHICIAFIRFALVLSLNDETWIFCVFMHMLEIKALPVYLCYANIVKTGFLDYSLAK